MINPDTEAQLGQKARAWLASFPQDAPAIVVPVFNAYDDVLECVDSLISSVPGDVPILLLDDASTDPRICDTLEALSSSGRFAYLRKPSNSGFVGTVNLAFEWCAPRDAVIINSDIVVPPGWLERLQAAAYAHSTIATATPLTNHGTILSVPRRNTPLSDLVEGLTVAQADNKIRASSLMLRPVIPAAVGHCVYFKRSALDVAGYFDEVFAPGYGEEVDFSQRAVASGFCHVAVDDLFVYHKGSRSFDLKGQEERQRTQNAHEEIIRTRYPWYHPWVEKAAGDGHSPLAWALASARAALLGHRIAIDATRIDGIITGTQVLILELIRALTGALSPDAHLTMIVADGTPKEAFLGIDQLVDEVVPISELAELEQPRFDLVHRPSQISSVEDLAFLQSIAHRFIVSYLDCISFSNPSYAANPEAWEQYRAATKATVVTADGIIFISQDAAQDAARQGLHLSDDRKQVTYVGVDHQLRSDESHSPAASAEFKGQPFLLMLGTDFQHKKPALCSAALENTPARVSLARSPCIRRPQSREWRLCRRRRTGTGTNPRDPAPRA